MTGLDSYYSGNLYRDMFDYPQLYMNMYRAEDYARGESNEN